MRLGLAQVCIMGIVLGLFGSTGAQVNQEWVARYNGTGNYVDEAYSIAVDGVGNVYVTGMSTGVGTSQDYATVKYDAAGNPLWTARYNGTGNAGDKAKQVVVDGSGNVYVTGYSWGNGTNYDYATVKYSSAGVQLWVTRYNGSAYGNDYAMSLAVDSDGNVYVTGQAVGSSLYEAYTTFKYSASGDLLWTAIYEGLGTGGDYPYALVLDDSSNVYVTGQSQGNGSNFYDYATLKYSSAGVLLWIARYDGPGNGEDDAYALAVDGNGNVFVTGKSFNVNMDYATLKYDASGNQLWVARYNGPGNGADVAQSIALGVDGSVSVTGGSVGVGTGEDYVTIKYDGAGSQLWVARYNGPGNGVDRAYSVGMDEGCNVYVTGESLPLGSLTNTDYATIRYDAFGNQLWVERYNGPANYPTDVAYSLAVDGISNIYVTGKSPTNTSSTDYATIKYNQIPGAVNPFITPESPASFTLLPPHPNPFNPTTVLSFHLPAADFVKLGIYDVYGRLVTTLVNGWREAGRHEVTFDGFDLPSGIYIYRIEAGDWQASGKMVLVK